MAAPKTAWGIDIGQCALKAIKLRSTEESLHVEAFEVVQHASVLSQSETDASILIKNSLDEFLSRVGDISGSEVAVSVLGQGGITKFVKLPPVEQKKIPDIVKFEAQQQIPFPLEEVTWRYQTFENDDSPEVEAGIFAIKQVSVVEMLSHFRQANLDINLIQMSPLALYNFMNVDGLVRSDGAVMLADVGAEKTHIIVADGTSLWTRAINIGGNSFTEALMKSFKLSFAKAEQLKRNAASSKYARQIFQVMRPVFSDLVQQIQRSIGFYTATHRGCKFKQLIGIGNGFKLPGMQKYLEQNLNMAVSKVEKFKKLEGVTPELKQEMLGLGVAYGLAAQALGDATITTNMLPEAIVRERLWAKKKPWFIAAAASVVLTAGMAAMSAKSAKDTLANPDNLRTLKEIKKYVKKCKDWENQQRKAQGNFEQELAHLAEYKNIRGYTTFWQEFNERFADAWIASDIIGNSQDLRTIRKLRNPRIPLTSLENDLKNLNTDQAKLFAIERLPSESTDHAMLGKPGPMAEIRKQLIAQLSRVPRKNRKLILLESMSVEYVKDLNMLEEFKAVTEGEQQENGMMPGVQPGMTPGAAPAEKAMRGAVVTITVRTSLSGDQFARNFNSFKNDFIKLVKDRNKSLGSAAQMKIFKDQIVEEVLSEPSAGGGNTDETSSAGGSVVDPDPLFPGESQANDLRVAIKIPLVITGDGFAKPKPKTANPQQQ